MVSKTNVDGGNAQVQYRVLEANFNDPLKFPSRFPTIEPTEDAGEGATFITLPAGVVIN